MSIDDCKSPRELIALAAVFKNCELDDSVVYWNICSKIDRLLAEAEGPEAKGLLVFLAGLPESSMVRGLLIDNNLADYKELLNAFPIDMMVYYLVG